MLNRGPARNATEYYLMALDQPIFPEVIACDERDRAALDELRADVSDWFASLTPRQRDVLAAWVNSPAQYDMFVALAAEAGAWERDRQSELLKRLI
jgi:hypothetical protein